MRQSSREPFVRPFGIAATLSDAVALTGAFGAGTKIGFGAAAACKADILAPASLTLQPDEAAAALGLGRRHYIFTFGNTEAEVSPAAIGPVMELLASASGTGFLCTCLAAPWMGRSVYQGHVFQNGRMQGELKRDLAPYIDGAIAVVPHQIVAAGSHAISSQLTALKERGIRLALLDGIDEDQCSMIANAIARQPVIAGPAWLSAQAPDDAIEPSLPSGAIAILSGALHRQTLMQTAAARSSMPVLDIDPAHPDAVVQALAWARPHFGEIPFLITSSAPPDRIRAGAPAAETLAAIAQALVAAGIRNLMLAGNDTAATILQRLGITALTVGAAFAGLRWLHGENINILIKPGGFGSKNLFLYDFEPQSRLNELAK